jgi:putative transferase (TIGR04331 family)
MNITSPVSPHPHRPKLATLTLRNRTHFHEILIKTLPNFFPLILLENYHSCTAWLNLNWQGSLTKTLLTENSLIGNEAFKFLSAALSEKGSKLIAFQHGGSYGSARYNPLEDHEIQVSDEFWSWGWRRGQDHIKPMTSPKLSLLASKRRSLSPEDKNYILFVGNSYPRYHYRTWSYHIASQADEYIDWQIQFLNRIRKEIKNQLIYRPYPEDYGWCFFNRFKDRCPDIHIDDRHFSYDVMMSKASLVICDMNVTTILESLAANIPTIVFWDPQRIELRAEAEPFFQFLRNVGILYNSPIAAADAVNEKWPKLQGWWKQLDVWQARTEFVNQYAYNSPDWENDWWKFLKLEVESVVHSRPVQ